MACIPVPPFPTPPDPFPFTFAPPPLPPFPGVNLCCKLLAFPVPVPPISIGIQTPAVLATINTAMQALRAYFDALPLNCPRE